jgi:hypothetical protein
MWDLFYGCDIFMKDNFYWKAFCEIERAFGEAFLSFVWDFSGPSNFPP